MRLQQPFRGRYILLRDCSSCCCPATALLWPLQLRQQAVYHVQTVVFLSNMFVVGAALAAMLGIRLDGPASRPGYCGITGGEEQRGCGPGKELGWFYGVFGRVDQCLQSCVECEACHYATYSRRMNDCSWYARCNLQTGGEGKHRSYRVRHGNGSVLSAVASRLARRRLAKFNGSAWVHDPARRLFFHEEDAEMIYLNSKRPNFRLDRTFQKNSHTVDGLISSPANGPVELLREWAASTRASSFAAGAYTARQHRTCAAQQLRPHPGKWGMYPSMCPSRCAVVGSSASLLSRRHGQHIDGHDDVVKRAPSDTARVATCESWV